VATLFLVSTPIGNLGDLTHRAEQILASTPHLMAEDTRRSGRLLQHIGIDKRMVSLHQHNEAGRKALLLEWLDAGEDVAIVTDAGTPLVSDPGARMVDAALAAGHEVIAIPGASAILTALVASGLPAERFTFLGFIPRSGGPRKKLLSRIAGSEETTVLFESPERLASLLEDLEEACGAERRVAVARELTKLHETIFRGTVLEARGYYGDEAPRGEVTVVVEAAPVREVEVDREGAADLARTLLAVGTRPSDAAKELAKRLGLARNLAYEIVQEIKDGA
jgi:16S rRNA (cytidine1402-2'-O)-methyltransferase